MTSSKVPFQEIILKNQWYISICNERQNSGTTIELLKTGIWKAKAKKNIWKNSEKAGRIKKVMDKQCDICASTLLRNLPRKHQNIVFDRLMKNGAQHVKENKI